LSEFRLNWTSWRLNRPKGEKISRLNNRCQIPSAGSSIQHPISCGQNLLDIQETAKYTPRHKKEVLINEETEYAGHYVRTPYAYQPKLGRKYVPPMHVDLGQGLLQLIAEVQNTANPDG